MESPHQQTANPSHDPSSAPSPLFLQVVQEIGEQIGLDAAKIVAGEAIQFKGVTFWISHHGDKDPDALVIMIHMGTVAPEFESVILRRLLEHNAMTPAGATGYYSLLPGTDIAAFCVRLNMARAHNACDEVLVYIGIFAKQLENATNSLNDGLAAAMQQQRGSFAAGGAPPAGISSGEMSWG